MQPPPIVRNTGGLADSVVDANGPNLYRHTASGFLFEHASPRQLLRAIDRALNLFNHQDVWKDLQQTGMREDFSWSRSASAYVDLYEQALKRPQTSDERLNASPSAVPI